MLVQSSWSGLNSFRARHGRRSIVIPWYQRQCLEKHLAEIMRRLSSMWGTIQPTEEALRVEMTLQELCVL